MTAKRTRNGKTGARAFGWALLALPAVPMVLPVLAAGEEYRSVLTPSGYAAVLLLTVALAISPLRALWPKSTWLLWLTRKRREIGIAAFGYAALHALFFALAIGRLDWIIEGMAWASMWTGWLSFALLLIVAAISSDRAMRLLLRGWKQVQRLVYPAAVLVVAHWLLLARHLWEPIALGGVLLVLETARIVIAWRKGRPSADVSR